MPKPTPIDLQDFLDKKIRQGQVPFTQGGKTFYIRPQAAFTEEEFDTFNASEDPKVIARLIINDYDGFLAAGGTTPALMELMEHLAMEKLREQGAAVGESEASSGS